MQYKEYADEHMVPSNESLYALLAISFGRIGSIPRLETTNTQALIEKCIVFPSNRKLPVLSVGGGWDALDPESRALTFSLDGVDEELAADLLDGIELVEDIGSTTKSGSMYRW